MRALRASKKQKAHRWAGTASCRPVEVRDAMSEKEVMGGLQQGFGRAERRVGEALDDPGLQARGGVNQLKGGARKAVGKAQTKLDDFAGQVADRVSKVGEQTRAVYDRTSKQAREVAQRVEPLVHERPYSSLGVALAAGVLIGLLLNSRGPKVIYVKPPPI
jgi:ElaB/YqjD/DUF883 family membrane-anchored ribosome-binding protein